MEKSSQTLKPRIKVTAACEACRRKKSRCDGIAPCSHCVKAGAECVFPAEPVKRGPKKGAKYRKRGTVEDEKPSNTKRSHPEAAGSDSTPPVLAPIPTPPAPPPVPLPQLDIPSDLLHHLTSLYFSHVNTQTFPILHQSTFLSSLSLRTVSPPLLYALAASSSAFSTHPRVAQLSASHIALDNTTPSVPPVPGEGWAATARHLLLRDPSLLFSLSGVQTLLILSFYELARGKGPQAFQDIATATRTSQLLGFDDERFPSPTASSSSTPSPLERELRRRVVWALFATEVVLAAGARSSSLLAGSTSPSVLARIPLPMLGHLERGTLVLQDFSMAGDDEAVPTAYVRGGRIVHSLHLCGVEPFLCRALEVWARVQRFVDLRREGMKDDKEGSGGGGAHFPPVRLGGTDTRDWDAKSGFAELSLDLNAWSMHLPVPFLFNPKVIESLPDAQLSSYYIMHILHHLGQIYLYRSYIPNFLHHPRKSTPKGPPTSGEAVFTGSCHTKAVVHAISLARVLLSTTKATAYALTPIAGFAAFTSATALLYDADVRDSTAGAQSLQFFLRYLVTGMSFYAPLKKMHATLVHLIQIHQSPPPKNLPPPPVHPTDFFSRYSPWAILEPALAPLDASSFSSSSSLSAPPTPLTHSLLPKLEEEEDVSMTLHRAGSSTSGDEDDASSSTSSSHEPAGGSYMSHLRELNASNALASSDVLYSAAVLIGRAPPPPPPSLPRLHPLSHPNSHSLPPPHLSPHEPYSPTNPTLLYPLPSYHNPLSTTSTSTQEPLFDADATLPTFRDPREMCDWLTTAPVAGNFWDNDALDDFLMQAGADGGDFTWPPT